MAIFQCKMCGANLNVDTKTRRVVCEYCGTAQSIYEDYESIGGEAALLRRVFLWLWRIMNSRRHMGFVIKY